MPCHSAITENNLYVGPNETVEEVLKKIKKAKVFAAAVVDEEGTFLGTFSEKVVLNNLIPVSVAMADGVQIDIKVQAAPGIAKRLAKVMPLPVYDLMDRKPAKVSPDDPIWQGVSTLTKSGEPLCVIDEKGKFLGMITYGSLVKDLQDTTTSDS